ncbi:MAG: hypothetical protein OEY96_00845 [Gammaproteobacteria bacterium]|nr:hypothetical protein [Gammaproteobacteria bacterium]
MKNLDSHVSSIIILLLILSLILAADNFLGSLEEAKKYKGMMMMALLLIPQGRIFTRMGDLKKMGQSFGTRIGYWLLNEFQVLLAVFIFLLMRA